MSISTIYKKTFILFVCLFLCQINTYAGELISPRLQIGINIFPAIISADLRLKTNTSIENITAYILYKNNMKLANDIAAKLKKVTHIRQLNLVVKIITIEEFRVLKGKTIDAVFVATQLKNEMSNIIALTQSRNMIIFSPFKGDVDKGILSGFKVTNKVLPAINIATMKQSNIKLKDFLLRISVKIDE